MKPYCIITDATADLSPDVALANEIIILPMTVTFQGSEIVYSTEDQEFMRSDFYQKLRNGEVAVTSQINMFQFISIFSKILEQGTDILYIAFSSGMSGMYLAAIQAREELSSRWPESKIVIVDSLAASSGEGLLAVSVAKLKKAGKTLKEVSEWAEQNKQRLNAWVTVDDLMYLKRSGRITTTEAFLGSVLGVKPIIHVNQDGKLVPVKKVRGRKQALKALLESMDGFAPGYGDQTIYISNGDCLDEARTLAKMIQEKYKPISVELFSIGPVVGSHSGPGTIALFFYANHKSIQGV